MNTPFDVNSFQQEVNANSSPEEVCTIIEKYADGIASGQFRIDPANVATPSKKAAIGFLHDIMPVSDAIYIDRIATCIKCPNAKIVVAKPRMITCGVCHCIMNFKARLAGADCPAGFFGAASR